MKSIHRDTPLGEIVLRKYEKPYAIEGRELVRKLCLSTGLLQPGDSRDIVVDVLYVLLAVKKGRKELSSEEIQQMVIQARKDAKLPLYGIAASNIRRQLKRLRELFLVGKTKNRYCVTEFSTMNEIFEEKIERYLLQSVLGRVKEYVRLVDEKF